VSDQMVLDPPLNLAGAHGQESSCFAEHS
jgi:hypothetical protein